MNAFSFSDSPYPIRNDLGDVYRSYWRELASPGTWWTGAERVAIAEEVRLALSCAYCAKRKNALSPYSSSGEHSAAGDTPLSASAIDAVHRIVTDQTRITKSWIQQNAAGDLPEGKYVELAGIVVCVFSIDEFCRALGLPLEPLPAPVDGVASEYVPNGLESETAMVSVIAGAQLGPNEADLWPPPGANVIRAFSQVPNAVREWVAISDIQYLPLQKVRDPGSDTNRILNRMQIEVVAGRVSSHNECFY